MKELIIEQTQFNSCKAIYPEYMTAFSKSILKVEQANLDLVYSKITFPNNVWTETRYPRLDQSTGTSTIFFDLKEAIKAYFNSVDKFGDLNNQDTYKLMHDKIQITIETKTDIGDPPIIKTFDVFASYSSYILQTGLIQDTEYLYNYHKDGVSFDQIISLPFLYDADPLVDLLVGVTADDVFIDWINWKTHPLFEVQLANVILLDCYRGGDFNNNLDLYNRPCKIILEKKKTCGDIFRYINNRGMIRYISMRRLSTNISTKKEQSFVFDKYEQDIVINDQINKPFFKKTNQSEVITYKEDNITDDYLPLFMNFIKSSFVQIYNEDKGFWSNVDIQNSSVKRKRKDVLTDISVNIMVETDNNIY